MIAASSTAISTTWSTSMPEAFRASAWGIVRGKPSKRKPRRAVGRLDPLLHERDDDVVGDELAAVHDRLGREAPRRAGLDGRAQHVPGGDLRNRVTSA